MKHSMIIFSFFSILFSSCYFERIVDIEEEAITTHLVFNGIFYAGRDTNYFHLSESYPLYNHNHDTGSIESNKPAGKMIQDMGFTCEINGEKRLVEYDPSDSVYILPGRLQEKDSLLLRGMYQGKEIKSKTRLPFAPQVMAMDTATVIRFESNYLQECILFRVKIKKNPNENNYYRLLINNQLYYKELGEFHPWYQSNIYYTNDPVLINGYTGISGKAGIGQVYFSDNFFSVFRDAMFKEEEHTLTFYVEKYPSSPIYNTIQNHMSVRLQSISEDLYKYYSSLQYSGSFSSGNTSTPVIIHTNIDNGLGILGACNEILIFEDTLKKMNARLTKE